MQNVKQIKKNLKSHSQRPAFSGGSTFQSQDALLNVLKITVSAKPLESFTTLPPPDGYQGDACESKSDMVCYPYAVHDCVMN